MSEARATGARVVIVNAEPTPFDDLADAVLREPIGKSLPLILSRRFFGFLVVLRVSVRVADVKRQQVQVLLRAP